MKSRKLPDKNFSDYWLAMSDAAAFNLAQTALMLSGKLRTDIAAQTRTAPALHATEIAVLLLTAADSGWGKLKSDHIVKEIMGTVQIDSLLMAKVYLLVYQTVGLLPETAWSPERLRARTELLAALHKTAHDMQPALPAHSLKEEVAEQEWLRKLRESRKTATPQE